VPIQALTIRTRAELEQDKKETNGSVAAKNPTSGPNPSAREKEELQGVFQIKDGRAVFTPVETGIMGTTDIEILKGIGQGQEIVTGTYQALRTLKTDTKVKIDNSKGASANASGSSTS